jgi:hypothetical protein
MRTPNDFEGQYFKTGLFQQPAMVTSCSAQQSW